MQSRLALPKITFHLLFLFITLFISACAFVTVPLSATKEVDLIRINNLEQAILSLGPDIYPDEAKIAARISVNYSRHLINQYEIDSPALFHNFLVVSGIKSRGLCIDWTADLIARFEQQEFISLDLHWAIANYTSIFSLEHSTAVISAYGDSFDQGIVLDPWRNSGELFWSKTKQDPDYQWFSQAEIHALKRQRKAARDRVNELM